MEEIILQIATGQRFDTKYWKPVNISWSALASRLTSTHTTAETYSEFLRMSAQDQSAVKQSAGAFVGATLVGGSRNLDKVQSRQLLTLDLDFARQDAKENIAKTLLCTFGEVLYCIHSTHKHCPEKPRYRLVIPLDREVNREEHEAVARMVASLIDLHQFDPTTFDANRLMFWPTTAKDGVFDTYNNDMPWCSPLSVEAVLEYYADWRDIMSWPRHTAQETDTVRSQITKQQDPTEKAGVIGAFCRVYDIHQAIDKYLSDKYTQSDQDENRYTYVLGSTANGLIVYDDKFAYSHHGTDPTSGTLTNAFDLVRMHLFGLEDTSKSSAKSMKLMKELATADKAVLTELARVKYEAVMEDFTDLTPTPDESPEFTPVDVIKAGGEADQNGVLLKSQLNLSIIFENDKNLKDIFYTDTLTGRRMIHKSAIWNKTDKVFPAPFVDREALVFKYIGVKYGISVKHLIDAELSSAFLSNLIDPVKEYFNGLSWDRQERLDTLLIDTFGAEDNVYTREATRKHFTAAVARTFEPGRKYDMVLSLVSEMQGTGKSSFIARMSRGWSSDSIHDLNPQKAGESISGALLVEVAELVATKKSEKETVRRFFTATCDKFRPAYGRDVRDFPRRCVFIATSNELKFLNDSENRRFNPIELRPVKAEDNEALQQLMRDDALLDQIWAEAVYYYQKGEKLYLGNEAKVIAERVQEEHREDDGLAGIISSYLDKKLPANWSTMSLDNRRLYLNDPLNHTEGAILGCVTRTRVCEREIIAEALGINLDKYVRHNAVSEALKRIPGWVRVKERKYVSEMYGKQFVYERITD